MTKSLHRHYKSHGKERRKRCVFRRLQKTGRDGADVTWRGRSFQVRVAATGKARSPTVDSRVRRTDSDDVDAERRRVLVSESADWRSSSARYETVETVYTILNTQHFKLIKPTLPREGHLGTVYNFVSL